MASRLAAVPPFLRAIRSSSQPPLSNDKQDAAAWRFSRLSSILRAASHHTEEDDLVESYPCSPFPSSADSMVFVLYADSIALLNP
jgi:hypothetical protein